MSQVLDPTTVRLSDSILLSDLLGCYSVYRYGYSNKAPAAHGAHVKEAKKLCNELLEPLMEIHGPCSFSYGYLSPRLSRAIVKYQDPNKPSYHRWDLGAAVDLAFHREADTPPIYIAHEIDKSGLEYARLITYSESPFICLASSIKQGNRRAFYENRYVGKRTPLYIRKPEAARARIAEYTRIRKQKLVENWRGAGYPTYHGGGIKQYQHIRTSKYTVLSDFLYDRDMVQLGRANTPELTNMLQFERAGKVIDEIVETIGKRVSIVAAYRNPLKAMTRVNAFVNNFVVEIVVPASVRPADAADIAKEHEYVSKVKIQDGRVRIVGWKD